MRVVITGVSGLLGAHLAAAFAPQHRVTGVDRHEWWGDWPVEAIQGDLRDASFTSGTMERLQPEVIIHCAGILDVDACERDPQNARLSNVETTRSLLQKTPVDALFVYVSTDSVFGARGNLWSEDQPVSPINVYANTKLEAERVVAAHPRHLIVRTNFYGWSSGRKKTAGEWLFGALERQEPITLFDDFFFTPMYVSDLVGLLRLMIDRPDARGLFHVAGRDRVSKYEFGEMMARGMNVSMQNVQKGSILQTPLPTPRPSDLSLSSRKVERLLGVQVPTCEEGVGRFLNDRNRALSRRFAHDA